MRSDARRLGRRLKRLQCLEGKLACAARVPVLRNLALLVDERGDASRFAGGCVFRSAICDRDLQRRVAQERELEAEVLGELLVAIETVV